MATSLVIPGHRISQADGSDHAFLGHLKKHLQILEEPIHGTVTVWSPLLRNFAKRSLTFIEINSQSKNPGSGKFTKILCFIKSTRHPDPLSGFF